MMKLQLCAGWCEEVWLSQVCVVTLWWLVVQPQTLEEKHSVCFPGGRRALGSCLVYFCTAGGTEEAVICVGSSLLYGFQGVVTYMLPVEAFATTIMFFNQRKVCLITWFSRVKGQVAATHVLDCWFLVVWRSPWSLDQPPQKGLWSLHSILIPVTNASTLDI